MHRHIGLPVRAAWLLAMLPLAARAQTYTVGLFAVGSGTVHTELNGIEIAPTGEFENTGGVVEHLGPATQTLINNGRYSATAGGRDVFGGPGGTLNGNAEIAGAVAPNFARLYFRNAGGTITISNTGGLNVRDSLVVAADLITTARASHTDGALRLRAGAAYQWSGSGLSDTRHVNGYVTRTGSTAFTFPVGSGTDLRTLTLNSGTSATDSVSVAWIAGNPSTTPDPSNGGATHSTATFEAALGSISPVGYWDWVSSATGPVSVTVSIPNMTGFVTTADKLRLVGWNGTQWVNLGTPFSASGTAENSTLTGTVPPGITALGVGAVPNPLPVTLVAFGGTRRGEDGLLHWQTAAERNTAYFELQSSTDGQRWQALDKVTAAGNSTTPREYGFTDHQLRRYGAAVIYYRLRQVDQDAQQHYSDVVVLQLDGIPGWSVEAWPNPIVTDLHLRVTVPDAGPVELTVADARARALLRKMVVLAAGQNLLLVPEFDALPTGVYTLYVSRNALQTSVRLIR